MADSLQQVEKIYLLATSTLFETDFKNVLTYTIRFIIVPDKHRSNFLETNGRISSIAGILVIQEVSRSDRPSACWNGTPPKFSEKPSLACWNAPIFATKPWSLACFCIPDRTIHILHSCQVEWCLFLPCLENYMVIGTIWILVIMRIRCRIKRVQRNKYRHCNK